MDNRFKWLVHGLARLLTVGVVTFALGHDPLIAQRSTSTMTAEQEVIQASHAWAEALERDDYEAMNRLLAEDFTSIQMTSSGAALLSKAQQIDALRRSAPSRPKVQRELQNATVRIHGSVGILTAIASYEGQTGTGLLRSQALISEVWVNQGGTWRLSHFQATTAPRRIG